MKEESAKKGFKVISITALILKIIAILTILAMIVALVVIGIRNIKSEKELEETQVVAEIEYTDDINELTDLEILQNTFGLKIYDEVKANKNIMTITVLAILECGVEFILLIMIFDGVQKLFKNLYETEDGLITDKNAKIIKNIGIIALLRLIIPLITNTITRYMLSSTVRGNITIFQIVCTLIIVVVSFITYYKIRNNQKEVKE